MAQPQHAHNYNSESWQPAAIFDTLHYARRLESAGVDFKQAEAHVEILREIVADQLCSKQDLQNAENNLVLQIEQVRREIKELDTKTEIHIKELNNKLEVQLQEIRREIKELDTKTASQIELLRRDLKIWTGGIAVILGGLIFSTSAWLTHIHVIN